MFDAQHLAARSANFRPLTPLDLLERTVEVHGTRPAVAWHDRIWDYTEFRQIVARMAHWLKAQGVGPGDVVSVMLTNRPEMLAAHFAVPALGAVLNALNTRLAGEEIAYILDHAGSKLVLCEARTAPALDGVATPVTMLCHRPGDGTGLDLFEGEAPALDWTANVTSETQAIALNYTSGTTGRPKGVVCTHRGAYLNAVGNVMMLGFTSVTRYLWTLPMFHCNGWCHTWGVTAAGGLHVCLEQVDPAPILELIGRHQVSHMCCAPVVLYMILDHGSSGPLRRVKVMTGGAAPTPTLLAGMEERGFDLLHGYGLTESYGPATLNDPGADAPGTVDERAAMLARQGYRHNTTAGIAIVDEAGQEVPYDGQSEGEIVLRSNTVMAGYYRDPEATEAAFAGGFLHTGDVAVRHPDGQIEIRDRAKDVVISGGENISSIELETVLHKHPDVLLAAVVAAPHEKWGETPWAFVEPRKDSALTEADLDGFCRQHLSGFKRPRRFVFGELPKTATGKIQKFLLRETAKRMVTQ
ncbi:MULTISPECIES: AMP-binding protein [unclassified Sulfitobacter]|uniref:AMP-binding protein n=1 Tax=unclassified Sulfitobacter TaxID=196795 RepID=UPI0007C2A1C5|nr:MULTISPECIES: AMP-binding protein [unclassified Sulfitobacter]KZX98064.1 acyl-CoA synthase [Sulfitobacter sp. HI0021]KZY03863.1 acyl-CoA synthase [Sulfitobacter sp. HI0027]KZZ02872.1 acyl-CoA synthase [Sulfitobacter sp. HI0076]